MSNQLITADRLDYQRGVQTEPLKEREIQMIHRLLADPSIFPREFKNWVTDHASDTIDIAKSQVHGLVNSRGNVIVPPPPLVTQIAFKWLNYAVSQTGGGNGQVIALNNVECDGNPMIMEFYAPFNRYKHTRYAYTIDGASQFYGAEFKTGAGAGGDYESHAPVYMQHQTTPSKGVHNFGVQIYAVGSYLAYVGGGGTFGTETYATGFFRISRA